MVYNCNILASCNGNNADASLLTCYATSTIKELPTSWRNLMHPTGKYCIYQQKT